MGKEEKYEETPVSCPGTNQTVNWADNRSIDPCSVFYLFTPVGQLFIVISLT